MTLTQEEIDEYFYYGNLLTYPTHGVSSNLNVLSVKNDLLYEIEGNVTENLKLNQVIYDPSNSYNNTTFTYTIPESGFYRYILGNIQGSFTNVYINVNSSNVMNIGGTKDDIIYLNSNNTFSIQIKNDTEDPIVVYNYSYLMLYLI